MQEVIVIGAGIVGASTAYHLARSGVAVTVIDRFDEGQATEAAAGIICPWISQRRNKAWYRLAKNGAAYYGPLIDQLQEDGESTIGYQKVGALSLQRDEENLLRALHRAEERKEDAPEMGEVRKLNEIETTQKFPLLDEQYRAVYLSGAARVDGAALRDAFIRSAQKHGAHFIRGSATLIQDSGKLTGVQVNGQAIETRTVVVTAGAWAAELFEPLGVKLAIKGQKAQIAHLQIEEDSSEWSVVLPPNNQYILPFDQGKLVIGTTYEDDAQDLQVTVAGLHELLDKGLAVAPKLQTAAFIEAKVGFRPVTPNFMPVIGEVPGVPGAFLANGLGASGLTVGPYLGSLLAKMACGKELPLDLSPYAVDQIIQPI